MKFKIREKQGRGMQRYVIESDKAVQLDYADAERLQRGDLDSFVTFSYQQHGKRFRFTYNVLGLVSLESVLARPFAPGQLRSLLISFLNMLQQCDENRLFWQRVSTDLNQILCDPSGKKLYFAYVPIQSYAIASLGINGALCALCERAQVATQELNLRAHVLSYARCSAVITAIGFKDFLKAQGVIETAGSVIDEADQNYWIRSDQLGQRGHHGFDFVDEMKRKQMSGGYELGGSGQSTSLLNDRSYGGVPMPAPSSSSVRYVFSRLKSGQSWQLTDGVFDIGRQDGCSIVLDDVRGLSRRHARIAVAANGCTVCDLQSKNGIRVNGQCIAPSREIALKRGDVIILGDEEFRIS